MSLQVWLPLNGDLHNQGLSDLTVTNNGATVNNSGKIGKCYSFDGTNDYFSLTGLTCAGWPELSIACWCYPAASFSYLFLIRGDGQHRVRISGDGLMFRDSHNSSQRIINFGETIPQNTWSHLACVYKRGEIFIYINGILTAHSTTYYHNDSVLLSDHDEVRIGRQQSSAGNSYYNGRINDFRIYDHALSAAEVAEIAKGLVLHYKLDQPNPNLIISNTFETAPWKTAIQAQEIYQEKLAYRIANHILYTNTSRGVDTIFPNITFKENTQYTLSVDWRDDYRTDGRNSSLYFRFQYSDGSTATQIISPSNAIKQWVHSSMTSTAGKTVSKITTTYGSGDELYIANLKLEEGSIETSYTNDNNSTTIYDCSGYQNNGTIVGNLTAAAGSPRYQVCTHFNGVDNCIITPYNEIVPDNIFTINLWFYKEAIGSKNYETLFGGSSGFEMDSRSGNSSSMALYMASTRGGTLYSGTDFTFNKWIMVTMVRDGTNELYYINGELKKTIEAKSMPTNTYRIGAWSSNTSQNFYGNMSDFRIYTTILSAEQIKNLYYTSMSIDASGNTYARELVEN